MKRAAGGVECFVQVVSAGRPENVERMQGLIGDATWHVPPAEQDAYLAAGAPAVGAGYDRSVTKARNLALGVAWKQGLMAVQFDDDLKRARRKCGDEAQPISGQEVIAEMVARLALSDLCLAGVAPTDNAYFARARASTNLFVPSAAIAVKPCDLLFDESFRMRADYDYTLQHVTTYGGAMRCDDLLLTFDYRAGTGGVQSYRNEELNGQTIAQLIAKWGPYIRLNTRRPGEILLKVPKNERVTAL